MHYVAKAMTEEFAARIIFDSRECIFNNIFKYAWEDLEFPEGYAFDADADSYLVLIPFNLRDPRSNGDYAFFHDGGVYQITFLAPSHSLVDVRKCGGGKVAPTPEFMARLVAAFAVHHRIVRVIDGVPAPRGNLIVPSFKSGDGK